MARITKTRSLEPIIRAAQEWIQKSLIHDRSVFSDESLWTKELVTEVRKAFVENPDSGDNTFSQKLTEQMRPASNSAKRLMAELMWALLLFPTNVKAVTKRQQVRELWETSGEPLPDSPLLRDEVLSGIGSGGTGFNTHRWREMAFLISVTGALKSESSQRRAELLSDYGKFTEWIETLPQDGSRQFRHMLRFFCFPDRVERMCSNSERIDVLQGFKVADRAETEKWSDRQLDEALLQLRTKLQSEQPSEIIDFYDTPWLRRWRSTIEAPTIPSGNMEQLGAKSINQALEDLKEAAVRADQLSLVRFVSALLAKRFVIFSGLAGSGKTKLAQAFAEWISPSISLADPFRVGARIPSDRITYIVKDADRLSVEFWNSEGDNATRVTLPRGLIQEWADFIVSQNMNDHTSAREIREGVAQTTKFSTQLNSFETHLKAAAFALLGQSQSSRLERCAEMVAVGADWTGNENILGYPNGLESHGYVTKPALDLILRAETNPEIPHFLILDEMNLSHVERYFADILSAIESEEKLALHRDERRAAGGRAIPPSVGLPKNLFIIGTVNIDETTYMFSPKVLDRANVIEFHIEANDLDAFLANPSKPNMSKLKGKGTRFGKAFVHAANADVGLPSEVKNEFSEETLLFFRAMQPHGTEFGYRVALEAARFTHFYKLLGGYSEGENWFPEAFDCVIVQKFLPKLHGSRAKLGPLLKKLWLLCTSTARDANLLEAADRAARSTDKRTEPLVEVPEDAPYPLSAAKIGRMWRLLNENGFASFPEA